MLPIIHTGNGKAKRAQIVFLPGITFPRSNHSSPPSSGWKKKGSISWGSSGDSTFGWAGEVNICQHYAIQRRERAATTCIIGKHKHISLESLKHGQNQPDAGLSQTKHYRLGKTYQTKDKAFTPRSSSHYLD